MDERASGPPGDGVPPEGTCGCKVGRLIAAYDFASMDDELAAAWTRDDGDDSSVRELTECFNRRLLRAELTEAGVEFLDDEVATIYDHLVGEGVDVGQQTQLRNRLEREKLDVETIESRFVSHQTVYRHLRDCLEQDKDRSPSVESELDRIHRLQNRSEAVLEDTVGRLDDADLVAMGEVDVLVNYRVMCEACNTLHDFTEFVEEGGCDCQQ